MYWKKRRYKNIFILINSFVNSLLGIEMSDNFRFKIISEEFNRSQAYSQTSEVKYYNIRSLGGYLHK